jgi:hypothetical protein
MTDTRWGDVVATALLGTDRRPVLPTPAAAWANPATNDPASQILDLAAQHRSWSIAGSRLATTGPPPTAPASETNWAPAPAQELLGRMLGQPEPDMINYWLAACVDRRHHLWPEHWQLLADLANASVAYDRLLLARAVGARGIWFLHQNPAWARLAAQVDVAMSEQTTRSNELTEPTSERTPAVQMTEPTSERTAAVQMEIDAVFTGSDHEQ